MAQRGPARWLALAAIGAVTVAVGLLARSLGWAALSGALLCVAMWRFFVPVIYEVDANGVTRTIFRRRRVPWREIRRVEACPDGLFVSRHAGRSPLGYVTWLYIPWDDDVRDPVLTWFQAQLGLSLPLKPTGAERNQSREEPQSADPADAPK